MNTKNILKTLALAMLLATACNKNEIANDENTEKKGFSLPVTVNVTREGDDATKATYTDNGDGTGSLAFSAGDKLFVKGYAGGYYYEFAGTLDYVSEGTFSGTIYIDNEWTGTFEELLEAVDEATATLLPNGYGSTGFLSINNNSTPDDATDDYVSTNYAKAVALTKNAAVEQLSWEQGNNYSGSFILLPSSAILNFTITGFAASTQVAVVFTSNNGTVNENVTTDALGNATFALGVSGGEGLHNCTLSVAGNPITLVSSSKTLTAGKIYNITRAVTPPTLASVFGDCATVLVKANTQSGAPNLWYGVTGTYNESTSEYATTSCGSSSLYTPKTVSMTKDGNNLVVFMQSNYNQITITFNTTNNTYRAISTSSPAPVAINTFITLIVNGVDITSTLTAVPSETITLTGGDMGEHTFSGTHFQVTGFADDSSIIVDYWDNMVISAKTGKTIVDVVFSYNVDLDLDALTFSSGTFNGSNMVENVNATSLTVSSTSYAGTPFNSVTIYYSE